MPFEYAIFRLLGNVGKIFPLRKIIQFLACRDTGGELMKCDVGNLKT